MKLAVAIADSTAPQSAFVVWRGFEDSLRKAAELGYNGVELALKDRQDVDGPSLSRLLSRHGLEVSCISTGQVFAVKGLALSHPDEEVRERTVSTFFGLIELARDFGRMINIGRVRGAIAPGDSYEATATRFVETAERIAEEAEKRGVTLILEPVNRYETNFINSLDDAAALVTRLQRGWMGLMPDVFHMNIEDASIPGSLVRHGSLVKYIHLADSNRRAPGQGHIDFDGVLDALSQIGFDGWASVEILPVPDPDTAAKQAAEFLLPKVRTYAKGGQ